MVGETVSNMLLSLLLPIGRSLGGLSKHGLDHGDDVAGARLMMAVHRNTHPGHPSAATHYGSTTEGGKVGDGDGGYVIAARRTGGASRAPGSVAFQSPPGPSDGDDRSSVPPVPAPCMSSLLHFTAARRRPRLALRSLAGHSARVAPGTALFTTTARLTTSFAKSLPQPTLSIDAAAHPTNAPESARKSAALGLIRRDGNTRGCGANMASMAEPPLTLDHILLDKDCYFANIEVRSLTDRSHLHLRYIHYNSTTNVPFFSL